MRVREVSLPKEPTKANHQDSSNGVFKEEYQVTTITPIFGGGVEAGVVDTNMPIRAAAIRGQLRYWWRFLQKNRKENPLEGTALFRAERAIWGGMPGDNEVLGDKDYDAASKVHIATQVIKKTQTVDPDSISQMLDRQGKMKPLSGIKYALLSAKEALLREGLTFTLSVHALRKSDNRTEEENRRALSQKQWDSVLEAVRWWANFGGVGARTRRGLGSVQLEGVKPLSGDEVSAYGCVLKTKGSKATAKAAWNEAVGKLFNFRQGRGIGRGEGSGNRPGRSFWPEPDTIRRLTGRHGRNHTPVHKAMDSFPRAMFGLPIIYEIRGTGEPPKTQLLPQGASRMASPLILKAVANGRGGFITSALFLPTQDLANLSLVLHRADGTRQNDSWPVDDRAEQSGWWPLDKAEQQEKAKHIKPMQNLSPDPLTAFLEYFIK